MTRHVSTISICAWLAAIVCFVFTLSSCSAARVLMEDVERKSWADDVKNMLNDPYVSELVKRLRTLDNAEETNLAQQELDRYFREHVPFFHLYNRVPATPTAARSVYADKSGLDFGLGRGFSATQAAKHNMGLAAAAFPGGPGRRRRSPSSRRSICKL